MNGILCLAALLLFPASNRAEASATLVDPAPARSSPGWARQGNSLLLYGEDGSLLQEIPLSSADETATTTHETLGGVSPDRRLAWTLDRKAVWNPGRTKLLESRRHLRLFGASGQELWKDDACDLPERGDPILFSADGKTILVARHGDEGWTAEARFWLGGTIAVAGPFPRLISMALTPNGRYALARWGVPDKSDTHTFLDLERKTRKDVPSSDLTLGLARIGDDGVARSGSKIVFDFATAASSTTASLAISSPAAPAPPAGPR